MAKARAIVKRLKAVKNIRKITRTMELIATARFKKAMDRATEAAAYTKKISEIVADLSATNLTFTHPLLKSHETQTNGILLILTSNRGLCGGYNGSVLRPALARQKELKGSLNLAVECSGRRGLAFLKYQQIDVTEQFTNFEDKPGYDEVEAIANRYIELYCSGKLDRLDIAYTKFESASRQRPVVETLLPIGSLATRAQRRPPRKRSITNSCRPPERFSKRSFRPRSKLGSSSASSTPRSANRSLAESP